MTVRRWLTLSGTVVALSLAGCSAGTPGGGSDEPPPATSAATHRHHHEPAGAGSAAPARSGEPAGRVVVHADDQLRTVFGILVQKFEAAYPGTDVLVEFGPRGEHAQHLAAGAAVDILVSARATGGGKPTVIARNPLVIAVARDETSLNSVADLSRTGVRVAVCAPRTPCGDAARSLVPVRSAVAVADGPAAVAAVRAGTADAALVHRTDIAAARADLRAIDFPAAVRQADQYTVVQLGPADRTAAAFVAFTRSALAQRVLADEGFSPA
jgi:molybdate transport system substrate-binding protein